MISTEEESFPRGCRKTNVSLKRPRRDDNLFMVSSSKKVKKTKKSKKDPKETISEEAFHNSINVQGTLSYSKIQDGMVLLGCIRHITNFSLEIEFPGLTFGFVHITDISDPFTKYLSNMLEENDDAGQDILKSMFQIGQFVVAKVLNFETGDNGTKLKCSLKPSDINCEKSHNSFKKGILAWGCVQSVLDHGYEIDLGVKNCRVFLPSKNVDDEKVLSIGEPLWCVIHKSESTSAVTTLRVSAKLQHIKSTQIEDVDNLHDIIPGMQIELVVEKITTSGIQGKFLNNFFGYVDKTQLKSPLDQLDAYKEGKLLTAIVLYIEPSTKITHFTLRGLDTVPSPSYEIGDIVSGKVINKSYNGIYLKLSSEEKCFVTNRRLIEAISKNLKDDISEVISAKYSVGSKHTCRILDYSRFSRMYICAVDKASVQEKIFTNKNIVPGQLLNLTVDDIKSDGLVLTNGHIRGFVPNLHISNAKYSENFKKKFKPGSKVNARVLFTREDNIIFTLKSALVESDKCLTSLENVKRGDQYSGVVVNTQSHGVLVSFYNNILGWLNSQRLGEDTKVDPKEYFYVGQVINPWILGVKENKVILTLKPPPSLKNKVNIKVGQKIRGIVGKVHKDKIDIRSKKGVLLGMVPINHLSISPALCAAFMRCFKPGDVIPQLLCVSNKTVPVILSRREALANKRCKTIKIKNFEKLRPGNLVRCSFVSNCEEGIYVLPLIFNFTENILIRNMDIVSKGEPAPKFTNHQSIIAKIISIDHDLKEVRLTIKHNEVFDNSVERVMGYFNQYLGDVEYLRNFGKTHNWDICQYQPGERVKCKVEQIADEGGCLVTLPNKVKGLVPARLCPENLKLGQSMEGVFLSQDFKDNYVEVCLAKDISNKINSIQDGVISISSLASCVVEKVLVKSDYVLGVLKQYGGNKQLVYIPLYLQENDRKGCYGYYEKQKFKICVCGKINNRLIGMSKQLFLTLDKQKFLLTRNGLSINDKVSKIKEEAESVEEISSDKNSDTESDIELDTQNSSVEGDSSRDECISCETESSDGRGIKREWEEINEVKTVHFGTTDQVRNFSANDSITVPLPVLPSVSSFFQQGKEEEDVSSSDEEDETETVKKKRKLTNAERAELARQEEERLFRIEKELADPTKVPESAEQFERLLLADPNSSELWTRYITFHITATELDKARSVAKRALETIDMTLVNEKFNIWTVLLNLENLFGTKESFEETFQEAIKLNEPLDVYLNVIKMLSESEKLADMEEKIRKVRSKYKQEPKMWLDVAKVYYKLKKLKDARNLKEAALKSISDKKTQLNLIVHFAVMEFKYGETQQGEAIFETILNSDPKKVNIWSIYVDQLVKKNQIDQARRVLERSVCQRLPLKNMKSLFLKFRTFEEQYGTSETVELVKVKAAEYVANAAKNRMEP